MKVSLNILFIFTLTLFILASFSYTEITLAWNAGMPLILEQESDVSVTYLSTSTSYNDIVIIASPISLDLFNNSNWALNSTRPLGRFAAGTELVFGIQVLSTGQTYYGGTWTYLNSDRYPHVAVVPVGIEGSTAANRLVWFEDLHGGGDEDFNDMRISVNIAPVPQCQPNASQKCVSNAIYNFDSCGNQGLLVQTCSASQTCSGNSCVAITPACSNNSQCGTNGFVGTATCSGNNVQQNYITYICNNPGTASASCTSSTASQLQQTCSSSQTCSAGACVTTNTGACSSNSACGTNGLTGNSYCVGNSVYRNNTTYTCNNAGTASSACSSNATPQLVQTCSGNQTCSSGTCTTTSSNATCNSHNDCGSSGYIGSNYCSGNGVYRDYRTYTCNNAGSTNSYCSNNINPQLQQSCFSNQTCSSGSCTNITTTNTSCIQYSYKQCYGNNVYWFDSCGTRQDVYQFCPSNQTCSGNTCVNQNLSCTQYSSMRCLGNSIYWYDSCGNAQTLYQNCSTNQTCTGNVCVNNTTQTTYTYYSTKGCFNNIVYWYDSLGSRKDIFQNCNTTGQICQNSQCTGTIVTYTPPSPPIVTTTTTVTTNQKVKGGPLAISVFGKSDIGTLQWGKSFHLDSDKTAYFLITVKNISQFPLDNVMVIANLGDNIMYSGELKINEITVGGNIISGINLDTIPPATSKAITFSGIGRSKGGINIEEVTSSVYSEKNYDDDSLIVTVGTSNGIDTKQFTAAVSESNDIWNYIRSWFPWLILIVVLIILFVIIFKRLSSK